MLSLVKRIVQKNNILGNFIKGLVRSIMLPLIESNREQLQKMSGSRKGRDFFF